MLPSQIFCQFKSLFIYYKEISLGNYFLGLKIFSWVKNGTQRLGKSDPDPDPDKHTSATHRTNRTKHTQQRTNYFVFF